jgi:hypothetical protein
VLNPDKNGIYQGMAEGVERVAEHWAVNPHQGERAGGRRMGTAVRTGIGSCARSYGNIRRYRESICRAIWTF